MTDESWFAADVGGDFEESVRIDREDDGRDHRLESIDTYHVTEESEDFMSDFFSRLLGRSEDMRSGANYWLYGYYGSGKSHLLSVLRGLLDSEWLRQRDDVWEQLTDGRELDTLEFTWSSIHDEYEVIPISVNLLKHQGQKKLSFSEIVLRSAHTSERLTGAGEGSRRNSTLHSSKTGTGRPTRGMTGLSTPKRHYGVRLTALRNTTGRTFSSTTLSRTPFFPHSSSRRPARRMG